MNNITKLQNEVTKIAQEVHAKWDAQQPHDEVTTELFPWFALFFEQERRELEQLLATVSPRIQFIAGRWNFDQITNNEMDVLDLWQKLQYALRDGDQAQAARYRRFLSMTQEELW